MTRRRSSVDWNGEQWRQYSSELEITQTPTDNPGEAFVCIRHPNGKQSWSATGKPDVVIPIILQMIRGDWNAAKQR